MKLLFLISIVIFSFNVKAYSPPFFCTLDSSDEMKLSGDRFILVSENRRFKADFPSPIQNKDLNPLNYYIRFFNSFNGFSGEETTNSDNNAYLTMNFPVRGVHWVWIENDSTGRLEFVTDPDDQCAKKKVYVQNKPRILGYKSSLANGKAQFYIDFLVDEISKAIIDDEGVKITVRMRNMDNGQSISKSIVSHNKNGKAQLSMYPSSGVYKIFVTLDDRTYRTSLSKTFYVDGEVKPICPTCLLD